MWAGQGVGLVRKLKPAAEILKEIDAEASAILARLGTMSAESKAEVCLGRLDVRLAVSFGRLLRSCSGGK